MKRRVAFLLAILAQFALLAWMVAGAERILRGGRRIVLAVEPVDPVDPLSGRYLAIRPKIARLDLATLRPDLAAPGVEPSIELLRDEPFAVQLEERGGTWVVSSLPPLAQSVSDEDHVWLRADVHDLHGSMLTVDFGLERFYMPADAADPSPLLWQGEHRLAIAVRVGADGRAAIEELLVDERPFPLWNAEQKAK